MRETDHDSVAFLRLAGPDDIHILYAWANDETVRKNAFRTEPISFESHKHWFERMMQDDNQIQFIMENAEGPVGQVRLTVTGTVAEIDYSIASQKRGMGYGKQILLLLQDKVSAEYKYIETLVAKVKPQNERSSRCFVLNGFTEVYQQYELKIQDDSGNK